jgi:hypothetical protein
MHEWISIAGYSVLGVIGMAIQDAVSVTLIKAIDTGKAMLAGICDAISDIARIAIMSISGVELTSKFGWKGFIGVIPILITGFFVTYHSTKATSKMVNEKEEAEDDERDNRISKLERELQVLKDRI